jgi:hypothetical protein
MSHAMSSRICKMRWNLQCQKLDHILQMRGDIACDMRCYLAFAECDVTLFVVPGSGSGQKTVPRPNPAKVAGWVIQSIFLPKPNPPRGAGRSGLGWVGSRVTFWVRLGTYLHF